MNKDTLTVALISDVFPAASDEARLRYRLSEAKRQGAEIAVQDHAHLPRVRDNERSSATNAVSLLLEVRWRMLLLLRTRARS